MLFLRKESEKKEPIDATNYDFTTIVNNIISFNKSEIILFNENVLIVLLEQKFISTKLLQGNKPYNYPKFLKLLWT